MLVWSILSLASLLLVSQIAAIAVGAAVESAENLKALCNSGHATLTTLDDLRQLHDNLNVPGHGCSKPIQEAIEQLQLVVADDNVCTMDKANKITQFADNYLKDSVQKEQVDGDGDEKSSKLPEALTNFAIAYGMKVSGICSQHMIERFAPTAKKELREIFTLVGYGELKDYLINKSPVGLILGPIVKTGEIILPSDLMQAAPGMATKMGVHLSTTKGFEQLKKLCSAVLQPLYEPVLLPLAHLIRAGFNNREHYFSLTHTHDGRFWSVAVFMCETVRMVSSTGDHSDEVSNEQRATLEAELREAASELDGEKKDSNPGPKFEPQELEFRYEVWPYKAEQAVGQVIYDKSIKPLVKSYDANKGEVQRMQERLQANSFSLIFRLIRKGSFKSVFKKLLKTLSIVGDKKDNELEEAKKTLNELMDSPSKNWLGYKIMHGIWTTLLIIAMMVHFCAGGFLKYLGNGHNSRLNSELGDGGLGLNGMVTVSTM